MFSAKFNMREDTVWTHHCLVGLVDDRLTRLSGFGFLLLVSLFSRISFLLVGFSDGLMSEVRF